MDLLQKKRKNKVSNFNSDFITVAKTAGFCYGVKRAVNGAYELSDSDKKYVTLGPLIHNKQVVDELSERGINVCENIEDIPEDCGVIIRAHGVSKQVIDELESKNIPYLDLTCPFVKKIHKIVSEHYQKGEKIVIIRDKNHPEVIGINGWCNNEAFITYSVDEKLPSDLTKRAVCIVAQTTINKNIFIQIVKNIKNTCQTTTIFDTICSATKERQDEAKEIAKQSDIMFVIGGAQSSNSQKLYEIAKANCAESYFIENFEDIPQNIYLKKGEILWK